MTQSAAVHEYDAPGPGGVNQRQIFWASFLTLIAAGIGFAIRGGILGDWGAQFGFTKSELGTITGGGLVGFGLTIIFFSLFADQVGYRALLIGAFVLHVLSAIVTLAATPVFNSAGRDATYWCLYVGMFMFALANGLAEAAINPLVATLYPKQKTHYLNILHAGWPGGLIIGAVLAWLFVGPDAQVTRLRWEIPISFFLIPTLWYGFITLKERFPMSEAKAAGVSFAEQFTVLLAPMLLFLFVLHALVGYVELGTDSWITNIMQNTIQGNALLLFIYTSGLMFVLRFFAGPIVHRINPLGLLFVSAVLGAIGLYCLGTFTTGMMIVVAATIYGLGKTFLWPTMLGVVGERFPKGGALAMGITGGIGMLSAGLLGGPGIGYKQDYFASQYLQERNPSAYADVKAGAENRFLFFPSVTGLDGSKVEATTKESPYYSDVTAANIYGGRQALRYTALVPAAMAVGYLLLVIYFLTKGGYRAVHLDASGEQVEDRRPKSDLDAAVAS